MTQLVKINAADYGLEETKAKQISDMFKPMLDKMVDLEKEFNEIAKSEISKEVCIEAKALRLKYVTVRTGTAEIHKELKAFYLQGGRFVDGWKNAQLMASEGIEGKLRDIEKHYENLELQRIGKLHDKRVVELEKYGVDFVPDNLGEMESEVWENYISGVKLNYQAKIDAEKQAEEVRQENIILDKRESDRREKILPYQDYWGGVIDAGTLRDLSDELFEKAFDSIVIAKKDDDEKQEQIRKDNLRLQKEAEERERKRIAEESKRKAQEEKDRKIREAELKKIQDEKDRIAKELQDKKDAEEKAEQDRIENLEAEKTKDDSAKVGDLLDDLNSLKTKYQFKSVKNKKMYSDVGLLIDKIIAHIN